MLNPDTLALLDRLAHDLRAPLHSVLALCELLQSGVYGEVAAAQREPIADLEMEGRRMRDLVEETLDLVRLAAGRYKPEPEDIDVSQVVTRVAVRHGAHIRGAAEARARQDPAKLERLLDRLMAHAARSGAVSVEVISAQEIRVAPAGEVSFDPLDAPHPLGPPVAKALARVLGGDVVVESGAFVIRL
jgi:signal transduction histidine kinase